MEWAGLTGAKRARRCRRVGPQRCSVGEPWCAQDDEWQQQEEERGGGVVDEAQEEQELPSFSADKRGQTDDAI